MWHGGKQANITKRRERSDQANRQRKAGGMPARMLAGRLPGAVSCVSGREGGKAGRYSDGTPVARDGAAGTPKAAKQRNDQRRCKAKLPTGIPQPVASSRPVDN